MMIRIYIALALVALLALVSGGVYYYHNKYESEVTAYNVLASKNAELIDKIKADAVAVDQYAADSQAREDAAKVALAASQKQLQDYTKKAQAELLAVAQTPNNLCFSADFLYNDFIGGKAK